MDEAGWGVPPFVSRLGITDTEDPRFVILKNDDKICKMQMFFMRISWYDTQDVHRLNKYY